MPTSYETIIGLEVHIELATKTKIFCGCPNTFGGAPNTHICPVCMGMPGTLPVLNRQVVEHALAVGLALGCEITRYSKFDRKNYFYPDNPQNYQISQLYLPICRNGSITIETEDGEKAIGIHEIHMEEDAGKLIHAQDGACSLVDYNRAGVPLIEIVSEPDMRSAKEVIAYLEKLRFMIQYLGASDCKLQEGSMRADVNISIRPMGEKKLGTRTEMKNLNSFKAITRAIAEESRRQSKLLAEGEEIVQETRRWDDAKGCSYPMRSKEDAKDYRYFPEPDLPPLVIDDAWIERVKGRQPELREAKQARYAKEFGLPAYDIDMITAYKPLADLFEATTALCGQPKKVSNWMMGETMRLLNEKEMEPEDIHYTPENLAKLIALTDAATITGTVAKEVFAVMFEQNIDPEIYVKENGLATVNDEAALRAIVEKVIAENPQSVADYKNGKEKAIGFLVGQTMKAMKGKADASCINSLLRELL